MIRAGSVYRALLCFYPAAFRHEYGEEMRRVFLAQMDDARERRLGRAALWLTAARDLLTIAPKEHGHVILQDIRYTLRNMAASPGFALVAILSLALGIGANTAIYSLWHGVLRSALPVPEPDRLVMLSNPNASGVSIGSQSGERGLLTYAEFERLRDRAEGFSSLMASQSQLDRWQVRVDGGEWEEARGRLVSGGYFQVLGVTPLLGRAFTPADDGAPAPYAVISYDYWQRRFGGRDDVLGKAITVRKALTVAGVAPAGFSGETAGQRPDLWVPLSSQPGVLPGRDWLHDLTADKVMWLHVFGRLKPGVSEAQAQASANSVFKAMLESQYGAMLSPAARKQFLDQQLRLRPASAGASEVRQRFSDPLQVLMAAVGVILLIACANLANLLLARGAARQREMALKISLGASRARLVRQLLTESAVLAAAGGTAGLVAAYVFHRGLVRLITEAAETFHMSFRLEPRVLAFTLAATAASAILFGLLPAWLGSRADAGDALKGHGRGAAGPAGQLRWGRVLVAAQLALSLPLLAGAGLLARTLYNLKNADLGFAREHIMVARVDAQTAGYPANQRADLFAKLLEQIRPAPGVQSATFSENGLFAGTDSGDQIEVEGYTRKGDNDRGSRWDQVGPDYFSTLGVPMLLGREINRNDVESSLKVCVINESFARLFFAGRNPIGMHITTVYGDSRKTHEIVGVARDVRTQRVRGKIDRRYYVPATQPLAEMSAATFTIRSAGGAGPALAALRAAVRRVDPSLPVTQAQSLEDRLASRVAQDRIMARLAVAFGAVALALAAIGLYGVLSYGVTRRRGEIGIRIALGAEPRLVTRMILSETVVLIVAGLAVGAALSAAGSKLILSLLYGLAPHDPATLAAATATLVAVAMFAAYLPARRASRMDPMAALRQE